MTKNPRDPPTGVLPVTQQTTKSIEHNTDTGYLTNVQTTKIGDNNMKNTSKSFAARTLAILLAMLTITTFFAFPTFAAASWPSVSSSSYCEFIASKTIYVYRNSSCTTRGTSSPAKSYSAYAENGDSCRIIEFGSGSIKLQYPTSSGYKTGYIKRGDLLNVSAPTEQIVSKGKLDTLKKAGGAYYGYVAKGDKVWACGNYGDYMAIIYQAKSGNRAYKLGYVKTGDYNSTIKPSSTPSVSSKRTISDGTYYISSALNSNRLIDCSGSGTDNGCNVLLWSAHYDKNQQLNVTYLNNGYYKLVFSHSNKCLDVEGGSRDSGTNVLQWSYNGGSNQQWIIADAGNGYYYIVARHSGMYLDVSGGVDADGSNIQIWSGNGTKAQKFRFTRVNSSNAKVSLGVPMYKQNDSRWKNTYIGGKTIGQVGCTTTCIAMVYSYHNGSSSTPDAVRKRLSYSNNDIIWSSLSNVNLSIKNYNCGVNNDMLSNIYSKLKEGKPVIIGATTGSGGSQHWVVITGYTGSGTSSFSTSDFTINDPGAQDSKTLAQFLANGSKADRTVVKSIVY